MTLVQIFLLSAGTLAIGGLMPARWRTSTFLFISLICVYWLQPALTIRRMDFWLPTIGIYIAVLIWAFTQSGQPTWLKSNWKAVGIVTFVPIVVSGLRYLEPLCCLTPSRPPALPAILLATASMTVLAWIVRNQAYRSSFLLIGALVIFFIILKTNPLAETASVWLRRLSGQEPALASAIELKWLGFSYIAFRLIHISREYQTGRLRSVPLADLLVYTFFYPTLVAGPIDRLPRFVKDINHPQSITATDIRAGGERILIGVFKKFAIADTLALISLNGINASQIHHTGWAWTVLYAYSLRIYFDFSGYTDIALGIGRLAGFQLPENFQAPYLKTDLTAFWNSWHITLAQWFRAYLFNPLTRFFARPSRVNSSLADYINRSNQHNGFDWVMARDNVEFSDLGPVACSRVVLP